MQKQDRKVLVPTPHECPTPLMATEKMRETMEYLHLQPGFWENGSRGSLVGRKGREIRVRQPYGPHTQHQFL